MTEKAKIDGSAPDMQKTLGQLISGVYLIGVLVLGAYALFFLRAGISGDPGDWGTLGDYFGGVMNPVVSFATLVVAYAVWKQQREELRQTKEALEDQARTAEQQRQEQRFFDLLGLYQRAEDSIRFVSPADSKNTSTVPTSGKQAVQGWTEGGLPVDLLIFLDNGYRTEPIWREDFSSYQHNEAALIKSWQHSSVANQFDPYFRVIFRLLSESEALLGNQHYRYVKLLRAQFGRAELVILGFNLWLDEEGQRMVGLTEKYGLLKHLPKGHLRTELERKLPAKVFGLKFATSRLLTEATPC